MGKGNNVNNMGGDSVKISTNTGKNSTKSFNMVNINKGRVNTGKITPKRKSGHTIMMVNNNSASQSGGTGSGTKTKIVVVKEKNTADDQLNLALSE